MATISVLNTTSDLSGKTLVTAEGDRTLTGLLSFSRGGGAPFAVNVGASNVANLDADKLDGLDSLAFVKADGSVVVTGGIVISAGPITFTTAGQIVFPATQSASANANTLDDYEEGTWTPTFGGSGGQSGQVYSIQEGRYIKVGRLVHIYGRLILSTLGTLTSGVEIKGLPFTAHNASYESCQISFWNTMTATFCYISGVIAPSTTVIDLYGIKVAANGVTALVQGDFAATSQMVFNGTYEASA